MAGSIDFESAPRLLDSVQELERCIHTVRNKNFHLDQAFPELDIYREDSGLTDWFQAYKKATKGTVDPRGFLAVANVMLRRWWGGSPEAFEGVGYDSVKNMVIIGEELFGGVHEGFRRAFETVRSGMGQLRSVPQLAKVLTAMVAVLKYEERNEERSEAAAQLIKAAAERGGSSPPTDWEETLANARAAQSRVQSEKAGKQMSVDIGLGPPRKKRKAGKPARLRSLEPPSARPPKQITSASQGPSRKPAAGPKGDALRRGTVADVAETLKVMLEEYVRKAARRVRADVAQLGQARVGALSVARVEVRAPALDDRSECDMATDPLQVGRRA